MGETLIQQAKCDAHYQIGDNIIPKIFSSTKTENWRAIMGTHEITVMGLDGGGSMGRVGEVCHRRLATIAEEVYCQ
jgi:hypothetical protein